MTPTTQYVQTKENEGPIVAIALCPIKIGDLLRVTGFSARTYAPCLWELTLHTEIVDEKSPYPATNLGASAG